MNRFIRTMHNTSDETEVTKNDNKSGSPERQK